MNTTENMKMEIKDPEEDLEIPNNTTKKVKQKNTTNSAKDTSKNIKTKPVNPKNNHKIQKTKVKEKDKNNIKDAIDIIEIEI